jgi:hypothetical protein
MYSVKRADGMVTVTDGSGAKVYQSLLDGWLVYRKEAPRPAGSSGAIEVKVGDISVAYTAAVTVTAQVKNLSDEDLIKALASAVRLSVLTP